MYECVCIYKCKSIYPFMSMQQPLDSGLDFKLQVVELPSSFQVEIQIQGAFLTPGAPDDISDWHFSIFLLQSSYGTHYKSRHCRKYTNINIVRTKLVVQRLCKFKSAAMITFFSFLFISFPLSQKQRKSPPMKPFRQ